VISDQKRQKQKQKQKLDRRALRAREDVLLDAGSPPLQLTLDCIQVTPGETLALAARWRDCNNVLKWALVVSLS